MSLFGLAFPASVSWVFVVKTLCLAVEVGRQMSPSLVVGIPSWMGVEV
jgi:hypothetical protein